MNYYKIIHTNEDYVYIKTRLDQGEIHDAIVLTDIKCREKKISINLDIILNTIKSKERDAEIIQLTEVRYK